jgi:hypothetical protein
MPMSENVIKHMISNFPFNISAIAEVIESSLNYGKQKTNLALNFTLVPVLKNGMQYGAALISRTGELLSSSRSVVQDVSRLEEIVQKFYPYNPTQTLAFLGVSIITTVALVRLFNRFQKMNELPYLAPDLVNDANRNALIQARENSWLVADGIIRLHRERPELVDDANREALIRAGENARSVADGIIRLHRQHPDLVDDANREALIRAGENAWRVADGLTLLYGENPDLVDDANREALIRAEENAWRVADGLILLYRENPNLVNDDNRRYLLRIGDQDLAGVEYIIQLHRNNPILVEAFHYP